MVTPELKWPMTNWTPSPTNLLATETPCLGSETSSPGSTSTFWPRMPPALLKSSAAWPTPLVNCAPNEAFAPVIGPATPNLICASAVPAKPRPAARTRPVNQYFFIQRSLSLGRRQRLRDGNDLTLARYAHGFGESLDSVARPLRRVVAAPRNWALGA